MAATPQHAYQVLTKRHGRMRSLLSSTAFKLDVIRLAQELDEHRMAPMWPVGNVWVGVSVEDQKRADLRIPALLSTPAAVRFLSCEPLI
jgi:protein gp37